MIIQNMTPNDLYELLNNLSGEKNIYIYGAGVAGRNYGLFLNQRNIKWIGYVDSDSKKQGKILNDKTIYSLKNLNHKETVLFLIAVGIHNIQDVKKVLENEGYEYIYIDNTAFLSEIAIEIKQPKQQFARLKKFYKCHQGERCFIVGNGASLRISDIEKINDCSFVTNTFYKMYQYMAWRPMYYILHDPTMEAFIHEDNSMGTIANSVSAVFMNFLYTFFDSKIDEIYNNVYYYRAAAYDEKNGTEVISEDISKIMFGMGTSVSYMYQLAFYMGFEEIYLIGMDFSFSRSRLKDGTIILNNNEKDSPDCMKSPKLQGTYCVDKILEGHIVAKKYADQHDIKIYNATRGGKLDVFPRVNFDTLFTQ